MTQRARRAVGRLVTAFLANHDPVEWLYRGEDEARAAWVRSLDPTKVSH